MSAINIEKISIVHWYPDLETHKCGYCKNENGAVSYGMWAEKLTVEDYQNLIDRGWRRSGMYCYKPMMDQTCCPQYTIKCNVSDFKLSKSQKKIIKKFNKFLCDGSGKKEKDMEDVPLEITSTVDFIPKEKPSTSLDFSKIDCISTESTSNMMDVYIESPAICDKNEDTQKLDEKPVKIPKVGNFKEGMGMDPNKPPCKKAKLLRLERKQQKLLEKGITLEKTTNANDAKSLEQFLNEIPSNSKHKLTIKLVSVNKLEKELENMKNVEYQLYKLYQMVVHNDPPEKCTMFGFTRFLISSPLKIKKERLNKTHSTFKVSAELFKKYQMAVHNEPLNECGEKQFCEFLINTPLKSARVRSSGTVINYGTFHQQYWFDDKLIAVAVLDVLPRCVSSVYFFYDPDYRFLTLGTYGSLREIQYVQSLGLPYYYMGFYIHSCPKMRYKGKLSHSFLLCPETYQWFPIEKCLPKLDKHKYSRLNDDLDAMDENACSAYDIDHIRVCVSYCFTLFANYKTKFGEQEVFDNIGKLIGKKCAATLLFVSSKG